MEEATAFLAKRSQRDSITVKAIITGQTSVKPTNYLKEASTLSANWPQVRFNVQNLHEDEHRVDDVTTAGQLQPG